ncbi:MAG TPA: sterol desaturase family protein [Flavisolibacter sp.]|nr:sterol desaturase family protein [Flavisolibacter sp.]
MPTPFEILLDPISLTILGMYFLLMLWEALFPGRYLPSVKYWKLKGIIFFLVYFYLSTYLPLLYAAYLPQTQLIDGSAFGTIGGAVFGVLLYEFGMYVWHRTMHNNNYLWKVFHQMHHSAERLDTYGAFYFSPFDMAGWTVLGTVCFSVLTGLKPQAITITLLFTNFLGIFQHANIKTPVWLGYFIQRPESHTIHHAKGIHAYNYSDLPLFDILFGTFRNPEKYEHETGFYDGASSRIKDMLLFRDIDRSSKP